MATCTADALSSPFEVTIAVRLPADRGRLENVTVSDVAVALVTSPMAPLLKTTVLLAAVVSKPKPAIVSVPVLAARSVVLEVTTGMTVATSMAGPLEIELEVTTAVRLPALVGLVEKVTVSEVAVAAVTVPTAPLLKTTVLLAAVKSKPKPLMVMVLASAARSAALVVMTGRVVATWIAVPLLMPLVVTMAFRLPAAGAVERFTVSSVPDAVATVPTAPESKTTELLAAVVSKPTPTIST